MVRASVLARLARQGRRLAGSHVVERFAVGLPTAEDEVRAAFAAELDGVVDRLTGDAPATDEGWQQQYDAAKRVARTNRLPVDGQALLDALSGGPPPRPKPPGAERAALRTLLHTIAGGEVVVEDLLQAMATAGWLSEADLASVLDGHREAQLAGTDACDQAVAAMSITRLREALQAASITDLQRAVAAVYMIRVLQTLVLLIGMARVGGLDETRMPAWPHITADTLSGLQDDPMWWAWGRHVGLSLNQAGLPMVLVVVALGLLVVPGMLVTVEGYRDRLGRLAHAVDHGGTGGPEAG
jgi:hypothetical protein